MSKIRRINTRSEVKRKEINTSAKSILRDKKYFDCVNIKGTTENSGCSAENSLCNCPCTGNSGSAVPLFREPSDAEMGWARSVISAAGCTQATEIRGYMPIEIEGFVNGCDVQCHEKNYYSFQKALRTYSTFWDTPKKVPLYRNGLMKIYMAEQAACTVPGNLNIKVGDFIAIESNGTSLGNMYSGAWLISGIKHVIRSFQDYTMILSLMRDSRIPTKLEGEG
tara:strand:+ start:264 stop:932 length:669 start_codon:yes stop_codon:yes gene_type:complete